MILLKNGIQSYDKSRAPFSHYFAKIVKVAGSYYQRQRNRKNDASSNDCEESRQSVTMNSENISGRPGSGDLDRYLQPLSAKTRAAMVLRFDEDLSVDLIAERLGVTQAVVRMRISRGLQQLRTEMKGLDPRGPQRTRRSRQRNQRRTQRTHRGHK